MNRRETLTRNTSKQALEYFLSMFPSGLGLRGRPRAAQKTNWKSSKFPLTSADIVDAFASGLEQDVHYFVALRIGSKTRFGLLDIDTSSRYHQKKCLKKLLQTAGDLGLRLLPCESSQSGGWHIYLIFSSPIQSELVEALLTHLAEKAGIQELGDGICEVFPSQRLKHHAIRLPAQDGFKILDQNTLEPHITFDGRFPGRNIEVFSDVAVRYENAHEHAFDMAKRAVGEQQRQTESSPEYYRIRRGRPPKLVSPPTFDGALPPVNQLQLQESLVLKYDRRARTQGRPAFYDPRNLYGYNQYIAGRVLYDMGLKSSGTRNSTLRAVSFFLFFSGYTGGNARNEILAKWLECRHNGFSQDWINLASRTEVLEEVERIAKWGPQKAYFVKHKGARLEVDFEKNKQTERRSIVKLAHTVNKLKENGEKVTYDNIRRLSGLSRSTISKHKKKFFTASWEEKPELSTYLSTPARRAYTEA